MQKKCYNKVNKGQRKSKSKEMAEMGISDKIEAFIIELMKDGDSSAEFGRNELADIFSCVPSQINYVISTRFGPEKGYTVESRHGGGGYIKIKRINPDGRAEVIAGIKDTCDEKTARAAVKYLYDMNLISGQSAKVLTAAVSDRTLAAAKENRDKIRADIIKNAAAAL